MDKVKMQGIFEEGYRFIAKKVMKDRNLTVGSKAFYFPYPNSSDPTKSTLIIA